MLILKLLAPALAFAAMLLGMALLIEASHGAPLDEAPSATARTSPARSVGSDEPPPTMDLTPTPANSSTPTPIPPSDTVTTTPTASRRPLTIMPSRTTVPLLTAPPVRMATSAAPMLNGQLTSYESELLALVNAERVRAGMPELKLNPVLQSVARARAEDMFTRRFYSHIDPATGLHAARAMLLALGVNYATSENFYSHRPFDSGFVARAMQWFMGDAEHRDNILLRTWTAVGVGVAGTPGGTAVVTQIFGAR